MRIRLLVLAAAIRQQLGLKLEAVRAPVESLVIDHIERPTEADSTDGPFLFLGRIARLPYELLKPRIRSQGCQILVVSEVALKACAHGV